MKKLLNKLIEKSEYLIEELFAFISVPRCADCNVLLENPHTPLCDSCQQSFKFHGDGPVCLICRCPEGISCNCNDDKETEIPELYYWGTYTDTIQKLIHQFKFEGRQKLGDYLTYAALDSLGKRIKSTHFDTIISVPMIKKDIRLHFGLRLIII